MEQSRIASEAEAERQRRTNRRLRALLAGAAVFLLVAVAAGGFALYQSQLANQAEDFARSRELAASAIASREDDPTLSKLLAIEAASIAEPPVESVAALHRALEADRTIYRYNWPSDREVGFLNADLDPSGRYIAASGSLVEVPHNYVEVVDREAEQGGQTLWSFQPSTDGLAVATAYFTPDGGRVVFGVFFDAAPTAGASSAETGILRPRRADRRRDSTHRYRQLRRRGRRGFEPFGDRFHFECPDVLDLHRSEQKTGPLVGEHRPG